MIHGRRDLRCDDLPTPEPGAGQVRLRMAYAGVCGSDLHYYFDGANGAFVVREPMAPGHEVSGVIDLDPSGTLAPGTPVTLHPATFGHCGRGLEQHPHLWPQGAYLGSASTWPHTQGGMVEYLVADLAMVRPLPAGLSLADAALAEPLAVALHGINVAGGVEGARVLISGSGPIGLLAAAGALARGAESVTCTDVLPQPLERARALGVQRTLQVGVDEVPGEAYDVVLECSGALPAINDALRCVRRAGVVAQLGMLPSGTQPFDLASVITKEVQVRGCFRFRDEIDEAIALLADSPSIASVVTHTFDADDAVAAFEAARDSARSGKVLVRLWGADA